MSLGDVSYRRAPTFYDHLDHNIILFKTKQSRSLAGDVWVWRNRFNTVCFPLVHHERFRLLKFGVVHLPQNDRRNSCSILARVQWEMFCLGAVEWHNCLLLCKSNFLGQMFGFQKCTTFRLTLIWNLSGHLRNRHPGRDPICILTQNFPHDNTVCNQLWSGWPLRFNLETIKCQSCRRVQNASISGRFANKRLNNSQPSPIFHLWIGDHPYKVWRLCIIARFSCLPICKTFPCMSSWPGDSIRVGFLPAKWLFDSACWDQRFEKVFLFSRFLKFGSHSRCVHPEYSWSSRFRNSARILAAYTQVQLI